MIQCLRCSCKRLVLDGILMAAACVFGGGYENSWRANSAVKISDDGSRQAVSITWHVSGDLDEIGDPRGTDLSGKVPDTFKNIHIEKITYSKSDAPFDLTIPYQATWLSHGSADTTYPKIEQINATAFRDCDAILSVTIPVARQAGIAKIGMPCFLGCQNLTAIKSSGRDGDLEWSKSMCHYHTENGVLYSSDRTCLKKYPEGKVGEVFFVPPGVTKLDAYCFAKTRFLKAIVFSENAPEVDENAFADGSVRTIYNAYWNTQEWDDLRMSLPQEMTVRRLYGTGEFSPVIKNGVLKEFEGIYPSNLTIPDGVTRIGNLAFEDCTGLESVEIPDGVTSIGYGAFQGCSGLKRVTIPNSVTNIGEHAFEDCSSLADVNIPDSVESIGDEAFWGCKSLADKDGLVIVRNVLHYFVRDMSWRVTIPEGVTVIGRRAFHSNLYLDRVSMPSSLRRIGEYAFAYCLSLEDVTLPDGITDIEKRAFFHCKYLSSVTISDSVVHVKESAFDGCAESLYDKSTIPGVVLVDGWAVDGTDSLPENLDLAGVRGIGDDAFSFAQLKSVVIPGSVKRIGCSSFWGCGGLTSVKISGGVSEIGMSAFSDCTSLTSMTIPSSVTNIGDYAFDNCDKMKTLTLPTWCKSITIYDRNPSSLSGEESAYVLSHEPMPQYDKVGWNEYLGLKKGVKIVYKEDGETQSGGSEVAEMWKKVQTVDGAVFRDGKVAGVIQVKVGKVNKNGEVTVSGTITGLDGKKLSAKGGKVVVDDEVASTTLAVRDGTSATVTVGKDGVVGSWNGAEIKAASVGGDWAGETATVAVDATSASLSAGTLEKLLPTSETATVAGGKWKFGKAASVKWAKPKGATEKTLVVDDTRGKTNLSGLKLAYTPRTGIFKGSFKVYALEGEGKSTKLKKYTVNVTGLVVDGTGCGRAICKRLATSWPVTVE